MQAARKNQSDSSCLPPSWAVWRKSAVTPLAACRRSRYYHDCHTIHKYDDPFLTSVCIEFPSSNLPLLARASGWFTSVTVRQCRETHQNGHTISNCACSVSNDPCWYREKPPLRGHQLRVFWSGCPPLTTRSYRQPTTIATRLPSVVSFLSARRANRGGGGHFY